MKMSELENKLREHSEIMKRKIIVPVELKDKITNWEEEKMKYSKSIISKMVIAVAVLSICITAVCLTPIANGLIGYFKDIIRFDGAVIGTRYENATDEIQIEVLEITADKETGLIPLEITFKNPDSLPYTFIRELGVGEYKILDSTNREMKTFSYSPEEAKKWTAENGKARVNLLINEENLSPGEKYTVIIQKMYGFQKADAPLTITGDWSFEFTK